MAQLLDSCFAIRSQGKQELLHLSTRKTIQTKSSQQDAVIKTPYQHKTVNIFVENVIVSLTNVDLAFLVYSFGWMETHLELY